MGLYELLNRSAMHYYVAAPDPGISVRVPCGLSLQVINMSKISIMEVEY